MSTDIWDYMSVDDRNEQGQMEQERIAAGLVCCHCARKIETLDELLCDRCLKDNENPDLD